MLDDDRQDNSWGKHSVRQHILTPVDNTQENGAHLYEHLIDRCKEHQRVPGSQHTRETVTIITAK